MAYLYIDFNKVKGFSKLSDHGKEIFRKVYIKHNATHGIEQKGKWIPVKVSPGVNSNCIKVEFCNNEWLHYYADGTWG